MVNIQQQLGKRNTYTPIDASQVCCPVALSLNREETLSEHSLKTFSNNHDVNQHSRMSEQDLRVLVINLRNQPLMPTTPRKARHLLQQKKAIVIKRQPFVIQLQKATGETKQEINLGINSGYSFIGFSATTTKRELYCGELKLRDNIKKLLLEKSMYRRGRRNKLWYRQARFNNRRGNDLAPSIQHKLNSHVALINKIKSWLPITETIIDVASFDQQKMTNPEISGIEYQQGELQGYLVREYLLKKFNHKCVYCKKSNIPLEIEHVIPIVRNGSNRVSNLTTACKKCNRDKGSQTAEEFGYPNIQSQCKQPLKSTTFMNVVSKRISSLLDSKETYGYITKYNRIKNNIEKSHYNDAFVIANGTNQILRTTPTFIIQKRRNNRCLQLNRNGYKPSIRRIRYSIQPHDLVWIDGKFFETQGTHCKGSRILIDKKSINIKKVQKVYHTNGSYILTNKKEVKTGCNTDSLGIPPTTKVSGFPA